MTGPGHFVMREDDEPKDITRLVRGLERIKDNLPRYQKYPAITKVMVQKQAEIENDFLDALQEIRNKEGYSTRYASYHHWYKAYKGIESI